jgi:hypothetical protein
MPRRRSSRLARIGLLSCIVLAAGANAAARSAGDSWRPTADLLPRLAEPQRVGPYQLHPPIGYRPQDRVNVWGDRTRAWLGTPRSDGTQPRVVLTLASPRIEAAAPSLEEILGQILARIRQPLRNWTESPPESGTLDGIAFVRAYWQGTEATTGRGMRGFYYFARDGQTPIYISSEDVAPHSREALALAEAAVLTFTRRSP